MRVACVISKRGLRKGSSFLDRKRTWGMENISQQALWHAFRQILRDSRRFFFLFFRFISFLFSVFTDPVIHLLISANQKRDCISKMALFWSGEDELTCSHQNTAVPSMELGLLWGGLPQRQQSSRSRASPCPWNGQWVLWGRRWACL